jgi:hypothetical protein
MVSPKSRPKFKVSDQSTPALKAMLNRNSGASEADKKRAITELKSRGETPPPLSMVTGGEKATSDKTVMKNGGMAYGKKHMYVGGGSVTMNPGLKALKKASPETFKKITGQNA